VQTPDHPPGKYFDEIWRHTAFRGIKMAENPTIRPIWDVPAWREKNRRIIIIEDSYSANRHLSDNRGSAGRKIGSVSCLWRKFLRFSTIKNSLE